MSVSNIGSYSVLGLDVQQGTDTFVYISGGKDASNIEQLSIQKSIFIQNGAWFKKITDKDLVLNPDYDLPGGGYNPACAYEYLIAQPKFSPDGTKLAFCRMKWETPVPYGDQGKMSSIKESDIFILDGLIDRVNNLTAAIDTWVDNRLTNVTAHTSNFCWNPEWNEDGSAVSWSEDVSGNFDYRKYVQTNDDSGADADPYAELNNAQFNTYMKYADDTVNINNYSEQSISEDTNSIDMGAAWIPNSDTMMSMSWTKDGAVKTLVMRRASEAVIRQNGGILFKNGRVTLVVPIGEQKAANTRIGVKEVTPSETPTDSDPVKMIMSGTARNFYPSGQKFTTMATMILFYTTTDLDSMVEGINSRFGTNFTSGAQINNTIYEKYMGIYWWNPGTEQWESYGGSVNTADGASYAGKVTVQVDHFSTYAVGAPSAKFADAGSLLYQYLDKVSAIVVSKKRITGETITVSLSLRDQKDQRGLRQPLCQGLRVCQKPRHHHRRYQV